MSTSHREDGERRGDTSRQTVPKAVLFGVGALDPVTYLGVAMLLVGVVVPATYVPASRAARIDPVRALRIQQGTPILRSASAQRQHVDPVQTKCDSICLTSKAIETEID